MGAILTHRVDIRAAEDNVTPEELNRIFAETGFSRIPIYHDTIDNIIGVILEKDFYQAYVNGDKSVSGLMKSIEYTTETAKISSVLSLLQNKQSHMAVVIDEFGGTQGIVTMEDILEELVGEIWDEHDDVENDCVQQSDGSWLVSGAMSMDDFTERFEVKNDDGDITTVGGWVLDLAGALPREGFTLEHDGLKISVARVVKRRIVQLRINGLTERE